MNNLKSITHKDIESLKSKISFIGTNEFQVNNQGEYFFNEKGIYKNVLNRFHKIAVFK